MVVEPGQSVGSYRIVRKLGEGGMGTVFLAEHQVIGRRAAVKLLLSELSRDTEIVQRFFNEARATSQIEHPGLVDIYDFGHHTDGSAYIVMEFLQGESLAARLAREPRLAAPLLVPIARQIAGALGAAHKKGIVHRDLKPDNVFLVPDRDVTGGLRVKVLDFGIAKLVTDTAPGWKTRTGSVMGTPLYMSPEQCKSSSRVDARADIYSLGCMLFEMVCGRPPFLGEGFGEILGKQMYEPPPRPSTLDPSVPPRLEALILRMLAKEPAGRPQSMEEVDAQLEGRATAIALGATAAEAIPPTAVGARPQPVTTLSGAAGEAQARSTVRARRAAPLALAGLLVLVAGGAAYVLGTRKSQPPPLAAPVAAPLPAPVPAPAPAPAAAAVPDTAPVPDTASAPPPAAAPAPAPARPKPKPAHVGSKSAPAAAAPTAAPLPSEEEEERRAETVRLLAQRALQAQIRGQWERAIALANQALAMNPHNLIALHAKAVAACKLGDRATALEAYQATEKAFRTGIEVDCEMAGMKLK